jgi:hypothetical protein
MQFIYIHSPDYTDKGNASPFCINIMHEAFRTCSSTTCRVTRRLGIHCRWFINSTVSLREAREARDA